MTTPKYAEQRSKVMLGNLPDDFLRVNPSQQDIAAQGAFQAHQTAEQQKYAQANATKQITICIVQAQLAKNYSLTKMDPYVRIRIGHSVFETHTDMSGGKFPNWNKTITSYLPPGIKTIHLEVFDERTLTSDERIAYADFVIPDEALGGKFVDTWVPLSGKQGPEKEGSINITIYIRSVPYLPTVMPQSAPVMVVPQPAIGMMPYYIPVEGYRKRWQGTSVTPGVFLNGQPVTVQYPVGPQPLQNPSYAYPPSQPYRPTDADVKQLQEMFPSFDVEVIKSVMENCRGNKEQTITSLLSLSDK